MFELRNAKVRFEVIKGIDIRKDIKEGEIKLLMDDNKILTIDFDGYCISVVNQHGEIDDIDEADVDDMFEYLTMTWFEGLSYISLGDMKLYQDEAQAYRFEALPNIKGVSELSYNIDDKKYQDGDILKAISFELFFKDESGRTKTLKLI